MHAVGATQKAKKPLFMVKYKNTEEQNSDKTDGNRKFLEEGKAYSLTSITLDASLAIVQASMENINKPKPKSSLF